MSAKIKRTWKPVAAGILSIVGGVAGLLTGLYFLRPHVVDEVLRRRPLIGLFFIVVGIVSIIGGAFALQRKVWVLAFIGSICALFNVIGGVGILAIIFILMGRDEFITPAVK